MSLKPLLINISDLNLNAPGSQLRSTANSGSTTIDLYSIADFDTNKILLIGEIGQESAQIVKTHGSTAPTENTVTLSTTLFKTSVKDTAVYIINYDSIEISHADTLLGSKTVLATISINPEKSEIKYDDTVSSGGYYFTRYKETIGNTFSAYSDAISYSGYEPNTVGFTINSALSELDVKLSDKLTYQMLINRINACLRFIRGKLKRWSNYQEFNYSLGTLILGNNEILLPASYYDKNSNKSCLSLKVEGKSLTYIDKKEYDILIEQEYSGTPLYFTIYDGNINIPGIPTENVGDGVTIDFYTDIVVVDSDSDIISGTRYDMIEYWLKWEIRNITKNNGKRDMQDGDYIMFMTILTDAVRRESSGQKFKIKPKINGIFYNNVEDNDFETI